MVIVLLAHTAVTPFGILLAVPIPVAPVVVCVIEVNGVFIHIVGVELARLTVFKGVTVIVPVATIFPQPPVNGME